MTTTERRNTPEQPPPERLMTLRPEEFAEGFGSLRLADPRAQARVSASLVAYGQIAPVVVIDGDGPPFQVVDGFKRLRAAREIAALPRLLARPVALGALAAKAAVVNLNRGAGAVSAFEEALVIRSLVRDDGQSQLEIAALFGRHPSWICRRLALVERLCDEVVERMRVGLISPATARELAKLPRGNQPELIECLDAHQLTSRETATVVALLLATKKSTWGAVLAEPRRALEGTARGRDRDRTRAGSGLLEQLAGVESHCRAVARCLEALALPPPEAVAAAGRQAASACSQLAAALARVGSVEAEPP